MANDLITEVILDLDKAREQLKQYEKDGQDAGNKAGKSLGDGLELGFLKVAGAITAIIGGIVGAFSLKHMVDEATKGEDSVNTLASAMRAAGLGGINAAERFNDWAGSMQRTVGVADDVIATNAALLVSLGKLSGEGLERASKAALDLAAGMNIDVESAFRLVSKAASGHAEALNRYGFQLKNTGNDALDFSKALTKIEATFGGMAEGKMNTFSGQLKRLSLAFNDVFEQMGNLIIHSPVVIAMVKLVADSFMKATDAIKGFGKGGDFVGDLIKQLLEVSRILVVYIGAPLELLYNTGVTVFYGLASLAAGFVVAVTQPLSELASVAAQFSDKFKGMSEVLTTVNQAATDTMAELAGKTADAGSKIFDFNVTDASERFVTNIQAAAEAAKAPATAAAEDVVKSMEPVFADSWDFITQGFDTAFSKVALTSERFRQGLQQKVGAAFSAFRDGVIGSFASIGAALVKGEDVFGAFGKAILGVFGDLAIQLGSFYVLLGLGNLFLNPAAAAGQIAAGLGLTILGGALKALAGGGGGAAAPSTGGGVAASGGGGLNAPVGGENTALTDPEKQTKQSNVQVIVQGNVLDRRETGLAIADVLQETFGSNGINFSTGGT